ncbi:protocatechuate 3,4-dioxygenase subunit alpha [Aliidongia dinghuensis]|uniref:Protocatechuate 3,4-dioxygenase subunit alpha n=1 Tax=Aliidongia dinghuensis TaxID=1867774 RepID=A0A8J2YQR9_9PROT|nr:protocatechuate 3,4-dioxygenase subunit alpha [Aliidongia dinghuensis]GGF06200.1 protocatechuate 3,4-dioxygenase subunit alpha [Aliidongia dinghuensis]
MSGLTSSQTIGPFFHHALLRDGQSTVTRPASQGERIIVEGKVTDGDGALVTDAMIEIWQANAAGRYDHPADTQDKPRDPAFHGFGRARTDANGIYRFETVKPGAVPGRGNSLQAPHIAVTIFARGLLNHLSTRLYFADEPLNDSDAVLALVPDAARRQTLIATPVAGAPVKTYRFDIVLQGEGETVFFEI